jgi:hypothetical protein
MRRVAKTQNISKEIGITMDIDKTVITLHRPPRKIVETQNKRLFELSRSKLLKDLPAHARLSNPHVSGSQSNASLAFSHHGPN